MKKSAFTMIELVFVIVVLGILAAVAVPRLAATRVDAQIAKGRADVASIRSAIITERQSRLFRGDSTFITTANMDNGGLFGGVMQYPIAARTADGHWRATTPGAVYAFRIQGADNQFTYNPANGTFLCTGGAQCSALTD